jgi:hypothetical protein
VANKKSSKRKRKQAVTNNHVEQIRKLKARLSGKEDDRAQLQASARAAYTYASDRAAALDKLDDEAGDIISAVASLGARLGGFSRLVHGATEAFKGEPPGDDSIQIVIEERDAAVAEAQQLREQLAEQTAELSELRLHKLDSQKPAPPNWLVRAEREFDKAARILTNDVKTVVAQKALDWAADHRRMHAIGGKKSEPSESEGEKG